jgi:hypothetical protein
MRLGENLPFEKLKLRNQAVCAIANGCTEDEALSAAAKSPNSWIG